jgi:hypothetical protein
MYAPFRSKTMVAALLTASLLLFAPAPARAQAPGVYYYPAPGYYLTTAGTVYIPATGYYYNVPAAYAPASYAAPTVPVDTATYVTRPAPTHSGNPNNPPYYMGGLHSLHARGHDSSFHGR